ncbi:DUF2812 domain-containing protein [Sedimentibacter sp. zth1]|uniref:DUF2812 domain-containing protein n=1 Tax=Sedimentibacter sp. zth1 TaxID=2816908 RepID=UPI001A918987|nr:DUF2812 domain-containing protein [Sedimentibacter sp. zth1]QSX06272.1 DUF2812 domain-containing protein [Sedimentibacter sp. zth1]
MKKYKIFVDLEKEEQYLNEMANQGHILKKYSAFGVYHFSDGEKQDLKYRVDYRTFKNMKDFENYKAMFEDFGWNHVYGTKCNGNQYFLPKSENSDGEIFSSKESSVSRYKRLYEICTMNMFFVIFYFYIILYNSGFNLPNFVFRTPNLWEKTGFDLVRAVLFELTIRVGPIFLFAVIGIVYCIWAYKVHKLYKEKMQ